MGAVKAEYERNCKNERMIRYPSHFEAVLKDGRGRAKATSPKRKQAFFVGALALRYGKPQSGFPSQNDAKFVHTHSAKVLVKLF